MQYYKKNVKLNVLIDFGYNLRKFLHDQLMQRWYDSLLRNCKKNVPKLSSHHLRVWGVIELFQDVPHIA